MTKQALAREIEALRAIAKGRTTLAVQLSELDLSTLGFVRRLAGRLVLTRRGATHLKEINDLHPWSFA